MMAFTMVHTKTCIVCGQAGFIMLESDKWDRYKAGEHVQNVWPEMPASQREQIITGTHSRCWDELFGDDEP